MTILTFFLILFLLILVHEAGHFAAAKWFGIRVDEFGLGFPPKLLGKRYGETEYTFNLLPIGGFVRIWGEDPDQVSEDAEHRERSFIAKPKWQQAIVLVAGVSMNVLLAWILFVGGFLWGMPTAVGEDEVDQVSNVRLLLVQVLPESPAAEAGLLPSDEIVALSSGDDRVEALTPSAVADFIVVHGDEALLFEVVRGESERAIMVTPETNVIDGLESQPAVGVQMSLAGIHRLPLHLALWEGTKMTGMMLWAVAVGIVTFFADAFTLQAEMDQVTGPVGIVNLVGDASALGFAYLVTFTAFISLNLAVINMLPFPALDGGRLVFVLIEKIKGSPINPKLAGNLNRIGFALLLLLMVAVTYSDIVKLIS